MIAFGCAITKPDVYRRCAERGIRLAREHDSEVLELPASGSIFQSYNALIDRAGELDGLEALVLVHQDTEIVDAGFCATIREALAVADVGLVGCVGAVGVRSIAWWEGSVSLASFMHRFDEHGGGELPAFSWTWDEAPPYARVGEVDTIDGFLMVLSPWTVSNLRFDESLGQLHGYDFDFCLQVREAGRRVVTADVRAVHHHSLELVNDPESWIEAHMRIASKWGERMPGVGWAPGTWKERARRAEAERDAAKLGDHSNSLESAARQLELERALEETTKSISWRITAPLRWLDRARSKAAADRVAPPSVGYVEAETAGNQ
jgi:hypothetical protein